MKTPTIYEIKRATEETAPYFFARKTLKFFGQTMKSFSVWQEDGKILIAAPRKMSGRIYGYTRREFKDNKLLTLKGE